ncbi:MAG: META domain-containing protein, partial [Moraxella osloensis]|nr:META domain-containing protein [Moraxella osloensis]
MINNRVVKGGFKTSALLMLALTGCQTVNTNPSAPSERVPYVQLPIFIGSTPTTNSLQSYDWQLNNINSTDPITWNGSYLQTQNGKVTLNFNQNHITYNVGCNQLSNQYSLSKNTMQPIGTGISTLMGCGELQAPEQWLAKQMQSPSELQIMETQVDAVLWQTTADGSWLQWVGKLKPEVKYGKGETVFLEVKPKWQYCDNVTDRKCLEVRDINYDTQGLKTAVGQWHLLDAPIINYRH